MLYYRMLIVSIMLALLPIAGVQAQSVNPFDPWVRCELDELASEIVPATPNALPFDELPFQAAADRVESSSTYSLLEGNVNLSRGDQRLHAERITLSLIHI